MMASKEEILAAGQIELLAFISGMRKRIIFKIRKEATGFGEVPYLHSEMNNIPVSELSRLANEIGLPFSAGGNRVLPRGTGPANFVAGPGPSGVK
jgi:hypothetical protein